jgi:MATE family multidrug resistance protein
MNDAAISTIRPFEVTHATVVRLAVPMMLAYLSTPLVGAVGTAVIGQLGEAALIGGIAVAAVIFDVLFATFNFLRGATTGLTAQAVGAGNAVEQQSVLFRALIVALTAAFLLVLLQIPLAALGVAAMGISGDVASACLAYFFVRIWSAPFVLVNYAVLGWVIGRGEAGAGLLLQTLLNGVNIGLSLLFVLGWHWGVEGAAWASVLAEAVTAAAGLALALWRIAGSPKPSRAQVFDLARLKRMLAVNSDMMIRSFSLLFAFAFFTRQGAAFGAIALAANAVLMHFFLIGGYFLDGFATAAEQLAGRAVGARFRPAFEKAVRLTTVWGLGSALALTGVYFLFGSLLIDLMTTSPEVRTVAYRYLPWAAVTPLIATIAFQMDGIFIGATWSRDMRNMMLLSVVVYLAAWLVLTPLFGNDGLWAALLVFLGARSVAFHWRMRRLVPRTFPAQA